MRPPPLLPDVSRADRVAWPDLPPLVPPDVPPRAAASGHVSPPGDATRPSRPSTAAAPSEPAAIAGDPLPARPPGASDVPPGTPAPSLPERGALSPRIASLPAPHGPISDGPISDGAGFGGPSLPPVPSVAVRRQATGPGATTAHRAVPRTQPLLTTPAASVPDVKHVRLNVQEVGSRVAAVNASFRVLEEELRAERTWDTRALAPLVQRAQLLITRRRDLALLTELASAQRRVAVGRLDSPRTTISLLGRAIFHARAHAAGPNFAGTEADREAELLILNELSRELASLALGQ